jgi:rubrerythrin
MVHISRYDGSQVYRCKPCLDKWGIRPKANYVNKGEEHNGNYCPICHIALTTEKKCGSGLH